jgi:ATP-binding cassette, subfamily B, bacterial
VMFDIKITIHDHINKLSLSYFNSERVGAVMTKAVGDVHNLSGFLRGGFNITYSLMQFIMAPFLMIALSPPLFIAILLPLPLMIYAFYAIRMKLKPMYRQQRENQALINAQIQEVVSGIKEIKAFNMEGRSHEMYRDVNMRSYELQNRIMRVFSFNHQLQYGAKDLSVVLIAILGGIFISVGWGNVTIGTITSFIALSHFFYSPINMFLSFYDTVQRGLVSLERIIDFLNTVPDVKDRKNAKVLKSKHMKGAVSYDMVNFSYTPGNRVLHDVQFDINPGEKTAIVGPSGSGKSTLLSLLPRFYDVDDGSVRLDGIDVRDMVQTSLRQQIGIVFQETFLFYGTIRENLLYVNRNKTEKELIEACKAANIYDTIRELPDKLDTVVGERGVRLSGGQKQRIAIARVFIKDPAIVILDEATSAVDTVTEQLIQESVDRMLEERTAFIIAHRLSTIKQCDRIVVLDRGMVVEIGKHHELLEKRGIYFQLHEKSVM